MLNIFALIAVPLRLPNGAKDHMGQKRKQSVFFLCLISSSYYPVAYVTRAVFVGQRKTKRFKSELKQ